MFTSWRDVRGLSAVAVVAPLVIFLLPGPHLVPVIDPTAMAKAGRSGFLIFQAGLTDGCEMFHTEKRRGHGLDPMTPTDPIHLCIRKAEG